VSTNEPVYPKGDLPCRQAGKRGGKATQAKHGEAHYQAISKKGNKRLAELMAKGRAEEADDER
jgi:hypothetical protein